MPKMKFSKRQIKTIYSQIIDIVSVFGKPETIAENLSYIIHCLHPLLDFQTDWSYQNHIMLCFQKLCLGKPISVDANKIEENFNLSWIEEYEPRSLKWIPMFSHFNTDVTNRMTPLIKHEKSNRPFSSKCIQSTRNDHLYSKIQKAEQIWSQREVNDEGHDHK